MLNNEADIRRMQEFGWFPIIYTVLPKSSLYFFLFWSSRKKIASLEKERQDLQSTVDALQEGNLLTVIMYLFHLH